MKKLIALSLIVLVSCSKEIKDEQRTCTFNGQPVDCSTMNGTNNNRPTVKQSLSVESEVLFKIEEENGKEYLNILKNVSKEVKGSDGSTCGLEIKAEKLELELYEKSKLVLKNADGEFEFTYKFGSARSQSSKFNGTWSMTEEDSSSKTVLSMIFSDRALKAKLDCIPK